MKPTARHHRLIVEELPGETLVYDLDSGLAHCLNGAAGTVLRACNGRRTVADLAVLLEEQCGLPRDEELVFMALSDLTRAGLLVSQRASLPKVRRRDLLRRLALPAGVGALLPFVESKPASAATALGSCIPLRQCRPFVNECAPCYLFSPSECGRSVCFFGFCINSAFTNCDGRNAPGQASRAREQRR